MSRLDKLASAIGLSLLALFAAYFLKILFGLEGWTTRVPQWDPSAHALDSIHFARAFRHFSPTEFFVQLHNSAMWPPIIPLLQAPFHLIFGESILTARYWTAFMTLPAILLTFVVGLLSHRRFGLVAGSVSAGLLLISPLFQEHALQEMYEIPGISLCMITLAFYMKFLETGDLKYWRRTCLAGIVLFFAKFNYAVLIMFPIVVHEYLIRVEFRSLILQGFRRFVRDVSWKAPFTLFVFAYILFLFYVQKVGIRFTIGTVPVVIEKAFGNPLYLLALMLLVRNWIVNRELLKTYAKNIWSAPEPLRSLLRFDILPALVWMSYPVFFMHFFLYMFNEKTRHSSFWSMETLTFYPSAIIHSYSPSPFLGALVIAAFVGLFIAWKWLPQRTRFLSGLALFNLLLTISHPNYQVRYLMTFAPLLYLSVGGATAHVSELIFGKKSFSKGAKLLSPVLIGLLFLLWPPDRIHLQEAFFRTSQSEKSLELFRAICRESYAGSKNTVVGFSNYISPSSIALTCYEEFPEIRRTQLPTAMGRLGFPTEKSGEKIVEAATIDRFFVIDYSQQGFSPGRLQESFLLEGVKDALKRSSYENEILVDQGQGGLMLTVYRKPNQKTVEH